MNVDPANLARRFREMSDEELLSRCSSNRFNEVAQSIALAELASRGLSLPARTEPESADEEEEVPYEGDYVTVAQLLNPMDAQLLGNCLQASGIQAYVADANVVQTNSLWTIALGGVRVRVPAQRVDEAKEVIAAYNRGDFALPPDHE